MCFADSPSFCKRYLVSFGLFFAWLFFLYLPIFHFLFFDMLAAGKLERIWFGLFFEVVVDNGE